MKLLRGTQYIGSPAISQICMKRQFCRTHVLTRREKTPLILWTIFYVWCNPRLSKYQCSIHLHSRLIKLNIFRYVSTKHQLLRKIVGKCNCVRSIKKFRPKIFIRKHIFMMFLVEENCCFDA